MKLIRCDQCKNEIGEFGRHWEARLESWLEEPITYSPLTGPAPTLGTLHFCSESCAAAWFKERAPVVAE